MPGIIGSTGARRVEDLVTDVDSALAVMTAEVESDGVPVSHPLWEPMVAAIDELDRLIADSVSRTGRWSDLRRHIRFGQGNDLHDIATLDWHTVKPDIEAAVSSDLEPLPVAVADLGELANSGVTGAVSTSLAWDKLNPEEFERLLYEILRTAPGYDNVRWLMRPNAPDRGRDLSADKTVRDSLGLALTQRVIVQAKHWLSRSVRHTDIADLLSDIALWEPPPIHYLIVATTGRFTADAVQAVETHNAGGRRPIIDVWPDSKLEALLAERPHLVGFGLR
jgi:hypothetical protein